MTANILIFAIFAIANCEIDPDYRTKNYIPLMPKLETVDEAQEISPFIVGGSETTPHSLPFQAALYIQGLYFCEGVLISDSWVLASASCTIGSSSIVVQLGAHNRTDIEETQISLESTNIITHEIYNVISLNNDIALIGLPIPVNFTDEIQAIALPNASDADLGAGETVMVSGWGLTSDDQFAQISDVLNQVTVTTISNSNCATVYESYVVPVGKICTIGTGGEGPCNGDSGGPLTYDGPDGLQLRGLVSYGALDGCTAGYPAAYTRITHYLDWINTNTGGV